MLAAALPAAAADETAGLLAFRQGAFAEAYEAWSDAAAAGNARAARFLGVMFDTGEGVRQDRAQALRWYRRAADAGDRTAMFNIAVLYDSGTGIPRDPKQAARWYKKAADRHVARAEYNLALLYEQGDGVPRSHAKAERWFRVAYADGIAAAATHLGRQAPAPPPPKPATPDDASFANAQQALLSRSPDRQADAFRLFQRAAARHDAMAQYDLAWCYENGVGVGADRNQAYQWYLASAAESTQPAIRTLAEAAATALRPANAQPVGATLTGREPPPR